ncbi:hypothetical protein SNEBB_011430 [Seison nebaliae]|nr:hypothetical protein SNEBB_011430 [Seison nebaliae]
MKLNEKEGRIISLSKKADLEIKLLNDVLKPLENESKLNQMQYDTYMNETVHGLLELETTINQLTDACQLIKDQENYNSTILNIIDKSIEKGNRTLQIGRSILRSCNDSYLKQYERDSIHSTKEKTKYILEEKNCQSQMDYVREEKEQQTNDKLMMKEVEEENLIQQRKRLTEVKQIEEDMKDLNHINNTIHDEMNSQRHIINNLNSATVGCIDALKKSNVNLREALKLKNSVLPVVGACAGAFVLGPIGLIVGAKVAAASSVAGGVAGYLGGSMAKKQLKESKEKPE